jgi:hypothetical protein
MNPVDLVFPVEAGKPVAASFAAAEADAEKRHLVGPAVPFGKPSGPAMDGFRYQFSGPPENLDELIDVVDEHNDWAVVGRLAEQWAVSDAGLDARARVFNTSRGNDVLVETVEGVKTGFSVRAAFEDFEQVDDVRHVEKWTALHLGVVRRPAFTEATGLTLAASAHTKGTPMTEQTTPPAGTGAAVVELPTVAELAAQVAEHLESEAQRGRAPLARFATAQQFYAEFRAADEEGRQALAVEFALVDQITANNPGVMIPGWRTELKANLDARRPAITALGSQGLPDTGMSVSWPYYNGNLDAIIAQQVAEKAELQSTRIDILQDSENILTAGAASDISYQLLMRSSPSYLEAHNRILFAAWARYTEARFEAALLAGGTQRTPELPADLKLDTAAVTLNGLLWEASSAVEDATGAPADTVLMSKNLFAELGYNAKLIAGDDNTGSSNGRAQTIRVGQFDVTKAPFLPNDTTIVTNGQAAKFSESGPMLATEENVARLGRDVAVWGMYVPAEIYFPAGVRIIDRTA